MCCSTLRGMIPSFNMCVDKFLADLKPLADGNTAAPMKDHISDLTMDVISKVHFFYFKIIAVSVTNSSLSYFR